MAKSGNIDKSIRTGYTLRIAWKTNSQTTDSSNITVSAQLTSGGSSYVINASASKNISLTINGTKYTSTCNVSLSGNQTKTLFSKTVNVKHNSDGSKTCALACTLGLNVTLGGTAYGDITASGNAVLDKINVTSILGTISNFTLGNAIKVPFTTYGSFYHILEISISNFTKTVDGITAGANVSFTSAELTSIYSKLPSSTKGTFTFKLTTKTNSSGLVVGTSTKTATGTIPTSVAPSISSVTLAEATSGIATKFGVYVQNKSTLKVTTTATAGSGSTIENYKIEINGTTYNKSQFQTNVLKTSGSNSYKAVVTDARGRTATKTGTFTVVAYTVPAITTFTVIRCNANGTENPDGQYAKYTVGATISPVSNKNDKAFVLSYKKSSATTWTNITLSNTNYTLATTSAVVSNIDVDSTYNWKLTATDYFQSSVKTVQISTASTILDILADGTGLAVGKVASESNTLDIGFKKTFLSDNSYVGGDRKNDNEKNLYFQSLGSGQYNHNCKVYGGNGNSETSIGMWDSVNSHLIYRYLCSKEEFHFGTGIPILQNGKPILVGETSTFGGNTGNVKLNNGLSIQWGKISMTPTTASETYKATVKFPTAFTVRPNMFIIPQTSAPQNMMWSIGQGSTTLDGFDIYLNRTTVTATSIQWIAIGKI